MFMFVCTCVRRSGLCWCAVVVVWCLLVVLLSVCGKVALVSCLSLSCAFAVRWCWWSVGCCVLFVCWCWCRGGLCVVVLRVCGVFRVVLREVYGLLLRVFGCGLLWFLRVHCCVE